MAEGKPTTVEGAINERLAADLDAAEKERDSLRAMLGRPVNVNIQAPEQGTLKKIEDYLPQLTHISTNLSQVASAIQNSNSNAMAISSALYTQNKLLERIADTLERLAPIPADLGDNEDHVTDRYVHVDPENWSTPPVWDGRVCKRYGMAWTVFDSGPNDPVSPGGSCALQHPGPRKG